MEKQKWAYWDFFPEILKGVDSLPQNEREARLKECLEHIKITYSTNNEYMLERLREISVIGTAFISRRSMDCMKAARKAYVNGLFISCIATLGILGENIAIDVYEDSIINGKNPDK